MTFPRRLSWKLGAATACVLIGCISIAAVFVTDRKLSEESPLPAPRSPEATVEVPVPQGVLFAVESQRSVDAISRAFDSVGGVRSGAYVRMDEMLKTAAQSAIDRTLLLGLMCADDLRRVTISDLLNRGRSGCWSKYRNLS